MFKHISMIKLKNIHALVILSIFYSVGIMIHVLPSFKGLALKLTEPQLLLVNIGILAWLIYLNPQKSFVSWLIGAFVFTVSLEIVGVKTGHVFGNYHYGDTMNVKVLGVPLVIGLNWIILILGGYNLAKKISTGLASIILSGLLVVVFDFVMEPVAMELDYWQWHGGIIPFQNYIVWFFITIILVSFMNKYKIYADNLILRGYFIIQFIFFLSLRLFLL